MSDSESTNTGEAGAAKDVGADAGATSEPGTAEEPVAVNAGDGEASESARESRDSYDAESSEIDYNGGRKLSSTTIVALVAGVIFLFACVVLVVLLLVPGSGEEPSATPPVAADDNVWARIEAAGKMVVGTAGDYPPFEYYDDNFQLVGLDIAIIQEIGRRLGLEIELRDMAFDGLGNALRVEQIDAAISAISYTPERDEVVDFTSVYYVGEDAVLAGSDSPIEAIPAQEELVNVRVGVERGTVYESNIRSELVETGLMPPNNLLTYQQIDGAIRDLVAGRIDLVALDLAPAEIAVGSTDVKIVARGLNSQQYAVVVPQGAGRLQAELNQALLDMQGDGTLDRLVNQYLGLDESEIQPLPTRESEPEPPQAATPPALTPCIDSMEQVADLSFDHEEFTNIAQLPPGQPFQKGWQVRNSGTCSWDSNYALLPVGGNDPAARMGGVPITVDSVVEPGQTYDFQADLVAPVQPGTYVGYWSMRNSATGILFGDRLSVAVDVVDVPTPTPLPTQTPAPGIAFSTSPEVVQQGQCSTLTWATENVRAVYLYEQGEDWRQNGVAGSGSQVACPAVTTIYELRVVKQDGSVEIRQLTVNVIPNTEAPVITRFTVDPPNQIAVGQCLTIQWSVTGNVDTVTILRNGAAIWPGAPFTGSMQDCPPGTGQQVYGILAIGPGGTSQANWYVNVVESSTPVPTSTATVAAMTPTPATEPVIYYFTATPSRIRPGECVVVSWSVGGNASRVSIVKNSVNVQEGVPFRSQWNDCSTTNVGTVIYSVVATSSINQTATEQATVNVVPGP